MARLQRGEGIRLHYSTTPSSSPSAVPIIPMISQDLLDYLDTIFPDRINVSWKDMGDVREAYGTRRVIEHLRHLYLEQQENP